MKLTTMTKFKAKHKGEIFILQIKEDIPKLIFFQGLEDLKEYVFCSHESRQILFDIIVSTAAGHVFLHEQNQSADTEEIELLLFQYADEKSLIEAVIHGLENYIIIDTDKIDAQYWKSLQNSESYLYDSLPRQAFDTIAELINKE